MINKHDINTESELTLVDRGYALEGTYAVAIYLSRQQVGYSLVDIPTITRNDMQRKVMQTIHHRLLDLPYLLSSYNITFIWQKWPEPAEDTIRFRLTATVIAHKQKEDVV